MHSRPIRSLIIAPLLVIAAVALVACGADDKPTAAPRTTVRMGDFWYEPAHLTVPQDAVLNVVNVGAAAHSWILKGPGVGTTAIAPGQSILVDLRDIKPGTYPIYCDQAGHTQAGQSGTLTIA